MDFLIGFLENIIVLPILSFLIGIVYAAWKRHHFRSGRRKLLRFSEKDDKELKDINCFTANSGFYDENELATLGYTFEYIAVGELRVAFKALFKHIDISVKMSPNEYKDAHMRDLKSNLVLIGGPFHNCLTRELLFGGRFEFPFSYDEDANLYYMRGTEREEVYHPRVADMQNKFFERDYALIINIRNPRFPSRRLIALIGCRSVGCYGGAYFLSHKLYELKKVIKDEEYALVVRCECDEEDIISDPEFVKYYPLSSAS